MPNHRLLSTIATEAIADMRSKLTAGQTISSRYWGAWPYLSAMQHLETINDNFLADSASTIVRYFLANVGSWRGDSARKIKAELNAILKEHDA